jgi:hypothetical protein
MDGHQQRRVATKLGRDEGILREVKSSRGLCEGGDGACDRGTGQPRTGNEVMGRAIKRYDNHPDER